ncbi:GPI transamidase component [Emydomyces testavorans]|uniref:GPI transamidase component n=1 Tax=Emydomyces testavorans TaxID=2070801 RepID=A0AAF0DJT8_9EURO|nr:GPI transamidase component [Emydomyces testavorans]
MSNPADTNAMLDDDKGTMNANRTPPPENPESIRTRSLVVSAFWAVIIFLGLPMWWKTTSIYRARLPLDEMTDWAAGKACRPVFPLQIQVRTPLIQAQDARNLVQSTQHALDDLNDFSAHHLRLQLAEASQASDDSSMDSTSSDMEAKTSTNADLTVRLLPQDNITAPTSHLHQYSEYLDIFYPSSQMHSQSTSHSSLAAYVANELQNLFSEEKATLQYILSKSNMLGPTLQPSITGRLSTQGLQPSHGSNKEQRNPVMNSVAPELMESIAHRIGRSFKYADTYHLSFSLFTPGAEPSSWDIEPALREYLIPLLEAFSPISNFSINTQVQLYATFSPTFTPPEYDQAREAWTLRKEDLSAFINAAEWPLNPSIGGGPTMNFILYVPAPTQSPLLIKESLTTSWLIPQWGGVVILNPPVSITNESPTNPAHLTKDSLHRTMTTFSHQLFSLLGVPSSPSSLPLRLQHVIRMHTASLLLSASSTMGSLARLTRSLPSIPIPATVATSVSRTLSRLSSTCDFLRDGDFTQALASARVAEGEAERSFFEKSMVGQVYFPDEHKVAVYLPLLGPIGVPLVLGLVKEVKQLVLRWKMRRS